jgi:hypothetical protein
LTAQDSTISKTPDIETMIYNKKASRKRPFFGQIIKEMKFSETYLGKLRQIVGSRMLMVAGGRAVSKTRREKFFYTNEVILMFGHFRAAVPKKANRQKIVL